MPGRRDVPPVLEPRKIHVAQKIVLGKGEGLRDLRVTAVDQQVRVGVKDPRRKPGRDLGAVDLAVVIGEG
jgi:hypothetical protein